MDYPVKVISITQVTHNVRQYRIVKPDGYEFIPGQATDVSINKGAWKDEKRPFTFTCLNDEPNLEFVIKSYHDHNGVTNELSKLVPGDELIIGDAWGAIEYKGEGYFIAGGAGITPFIAILRQLKKSNVVNNNQLFFSNRTKADIILKEELSSILGNNVKFILTHEPLDDDKSLRINEDYLKRNIIDFKKHFYICGPDAMVSELNNKLVNLGASTESVIFEK